MRRWPDADDMQIAYERGELAFDEWLHEQGGVVVSLAMPECPYGEHRFNGMLASEWRRGFAAARWQHWQMLREDRQAEQERRA